MLVYILSLQLYIIAAVYRQMKFFLISRNLMFDALYFSHCQLIVELIKCIRVLFT